ncbi:MAG: hypothetical protein AAGU32_03845, partial [Bacillota bacterium]
IVAAVKDVGVDPVVGGVDNDKTILAGISSGDIDSTVGYSGFESGAWLMSQMVNLLNGVDIPAVLGRPITGITADNVAEMFEHYYDETLDEYLGSAS